MVSTGYVHSKIFEVEQDNVGTEGAHRSELVGESALRHGKRFCKRKSGAPGQGCPQGRVQATSRPRQHYYRMAASGAPGNAGHARPS